MLIYLEMEKCKVPGLFGDLCRGIETAEDGKPFCVFIDAGSHEDSASIVIFEKLVIQNAGLCPQIENAFSFIESVKTNQTKD